MDMDKECQTTRSLLERYLDREMADREFAAVRDHLDRCPECREQLETHQKIRTLLKASIRRSLETPSFEHFWPRIEQAIENRPKSSLITRIFSGRYLVPATVVVLLILLVGIIKPFTRFLTRTAERVATAGEIQERLGQDLQAYGLLRFRMDEEANAYQAQLAGLRQDHRKLRIASPQEAARLEEELGKVIRDHGHHQFLQSRMAAKLQERLGTGIRDLAHLRYLTASSGSASNRRIE
jgi:Putative zinc-finger